MPWKVPEHDLTITIVPSDYYDGPPLSQEQFMKYVASKKKPRPKSKVDRSRIKAARKQSRKSKK